MYKISVTVRPSAIDGKGVFTEQDIPEGSIVWQFDPAHDQTLTQDAFNGQDETVKEYLHKVAYLSPWSGLWVYPPAGDAAEFTNHSAHSNLSVRFNETISTEPYFVANRLIHAGEELTNNYHEFDEAAQSTKLDWLK